MIEGKMKGEKRDRAVGRGERTAKIWNFGSLI
jgi:hypothetical protein